MTNTSRILLLVFWNAALLCVHLGPASLIAHDEALYATRALTMLWTQDFLHPWSEVHQKPPGFYWLLAILFAFYDPTEIIARLPSGVAGVLTSLLTFAVCRRILSEQIAFISALALPLSPLFFLASRSVSPDPFVLVLMMGAVFCILESRESNHPASWLFLAGLCCGLILLVRGPMFALVILALTPFLLASIPRFQMWPLIAGIIVGTLPYFFWALEVWRITGLSVLGKAGDFALTLATQGRGNGPFYYVWNVPALSLPWSVFAIYGAILVARSLKLDLPSKWLLLGTPAILFLALSAFATRLPHYALMLHPFIAILASLAIDKIMNSQAKRPAAIFLAAAGALLVCAAILLAAGILTLPDDALRLHTPHIALGVGIVGFIWIAGSAVTLFSGQQAYSLSWIASLFLGLSIMSGAAAGAGILGNANPDIEIMLRNPEVSAVIKNKEVDFTPLSEKSRLLARFATRRPGLVATRWHSVVKGGRYAWVSTAVLDEIAEHATVIGRADRSSLALVQWSNIP